MANKVGRKPVFVPDTWSINPFDASDRTTCAHISIIIKRHPDYTLKQLAEELAVGKHRPFAECLGVLQGMLDRGHIGYFDDRYVFHKWTPREETDKCL